MGVADDTFQIGPESRPISVIYYPVHQKEWDALVLMVRTESDPVAMEAALRDQIHRIDKTIPRTEPATVEQQLWELESDRRFSDRAIHAVLFHCDCPCRGRNVRGRGTRSGAADTRDRHSHGAGRTAIGRALDDPSSRSLARRAGMVAGRRRCICVQSNTCRPHVRSHFNRSDHSLRACVCSCSASP
jgi:hypothetical protein